MNPLLLILFEAGLNIAKAHVKNAKGGEVLDTTSFILDAALAIDELHEEESGKPIDWELIRMHKPLPPPGELPETAEPGSEPVPDHPTLPGIEIKPGE